MVPADLAKLVAVDATQHPNCAPNLTEPPKRSASPIGIRLAGDRLILGRGLIRPSRRPCSLAAAITGSLSQDLWH